MEQGIEGNFAEDEKHLPDSVCSLNVVALASNRVWHQKSNKLKFELKNISLYIMSILLWSNLQ